MQTWARISCILLKQQYPQETLYLLRVFAAGNFKNSACFVHTRLHRAAEIPFVRA